MSSSSNRCETCERLYNLNAPGATCRECADCARPVVPIVPYATPIISGMSDKYHDALRVPRLVLLLVAISLTLLIGAYSLIAWGAWAIVGVYGIIRKAEWRASRRS